MVPSDELEGLRSSRWRKRVWIPVLVAALAGLLVYAATTPAEQEDQRLPQFELPLLVGAGSLSSEDLEGRPVVLNFWASWCEPCREETPLLERTYRAYRDEGVQFVGVNIRDSEQDAREFVRELGVTYPVVRDAEQMLARKLGVFPLPQTFFIDHTGMIASGSTAGATLGAISKARLERQIEELLERARDGE